jgi:hypothetical protein
MKRDPRDILGHYLLDGTEVVPFPVVIGSPEWLAWAQCVWGEGEDRCYRRVAWDEVAEGVSVSTIFLGMDHQFGAGPPLVFETMVFGPYGGGEQYRYATWDDAFAGHHAVLKRLQEEVQKLSPADLSNSRGETSRAEEPTRPSDPS